MANILSVKQLNTYLKSLLDGTEPLRRLFVRGEVSNFKRHQPSGHLYFTLKEEGAAMRCVMFRGAAGKLRFAPENGLSVIVQGALTLYERDGSTQIYVEDMQPDGVGALNLAFEQQKERLKAEGLFDPSHKKAIPLYPEVVGLITSGTGAAREDVRNVLSRRYPSAVLRFIPVLVQGPGASAQIANGIRQMNSMGADVLIVGRGGGSLEDLWAFNEEEVARAIFASAIPVISAVGHETDFTIADFVADLRAPTPSAAAELAVPDRQSLLQELDGMAYQMEHSLRRRVAHLIARLELLARGVSIRPYQLRLDGQKEALKSARLRLETGIKARYTFCEKELSRHIEVLDAVRPYRVLKRGYFYVKRGEMMVMDVGALHPGSQITLVGGSGWVKATVDEVRLAELKENESWQNYKK